VLKRVIRLSYFKAPVAISPCSCRCSSSIKILSRFFFLYSILYMTTAAPRLEDALGLLRGQEPEALLEGDALLAELVVGGEARCGVVWSGVCVGGGRWWWWVGWLVWMESMTVRGSN
jgi:hypothetical protein